MLLQPVGFPSAKKICTFVEEAEVIFFIVKTADVAEVTDVVVCFKSSIKRLTLDVSPELKPEPTAIT